MDMTTLPLLLAVLPFCLYAAWSDLKFMIIPNWVSIGMFGAFLVIGAFFVPTWEDYFWRIGIALAVLFVGFILNAIGVMGGGDVKMLSGFMPYIALSDFPDYLIILSASLLITLAAHRIAMRIGPIRRLTPDWKSWSAGRYFPMGISIATAGLLYLALKTF
jgi:prepilin peptidase CpaA